MIKSNGRFTWIQLTFTPKFSSIATVSARVERLFMGFLMQSHPLLPNIPSIAESLGSIMDLFLFSMVLLITIVIATDLAAVELSDALSLEAMIAIADLALVLMADFVYSFQSDFVTLSMLEIGEIFYNSPWYRLPAAKKRLLVLPIQRAQREFRLKGLGLIDCSVVVFTSVRYHLCLW